MRGREACYRAARGTSSPRTARTYAFLSSNCSAARLVTLDTGPAHAVNAIVRPTRNTMGATSGTTRRGCGTAAEEGTGAGFQIASSQSLAIDNTVSRLTHSATAASRYWPVSSIGAITATFATNPDNGGTPASENSGIRARKAMAGWV